MDREKYKSQLSEIISGTVPVSVAIHRLAMMVADMLGEDASIGEGEQTQTGDRTNLPDYQSDVAENEEAGANDITDSSVDETDEDSEKENE